MLERAKGGLRFTQIIRKLKRTLDLERRNLRSVRERLSQELQVCHSHQDLQLIDRVRIS